MNLSYNEIQLVSMSIAKLREICKELNINYKKCKSIDGRSKKSLAKAIINKKVKELAEQETAKTELTVSSDGNIRGDGDVLQCNDFVLTIKYVEEAYSWEQWQVGDRTFATYMQAYNWASGQIRNYIKANHKKSFTMSERGSGRNDERGSGRKDERGSGRIALAK